MNATERDDSLKKKLGAWTVEAQIPAGFKREVWQRIALKDAARQHSFRYQFAEFAASFLLKPQYATALILAGVFLGMSMAHVEARSANSKSLKYLETRYVGTIDPYQHIQSR